MRLVFPARIKAYGVEEMRAADTTPPPSNSQLSTPPPPSPLRRAVYQHPAPGRRRHCRMQSGRGPGGPQCDAEQPGLSLFNASPD